MTLRNDEEQMYQVVSVCKAEPPEGMPGDNWHSYVIGSGRSEIKGYRPGTLKTVTEHANNVASDLNERAAKGYSAYATRKKKPDESKTSS